MKNLIIFVLFFCVLQELRAQPNTAKDYDSIAAAARDEGFPFDIYVKHHANMHYVSIIHKHSPSISFYFDLDSLFGDTSLIIEIDSVSRLNLNKKKNYVKAQYINDVIQIEGELVIPPCPESKYSIYYASFGLSGVALAKSYTLFQEGKWVWTNRKNGEKVVEDFLWMDFYIMDCPEKPKSKE